LSGLARVMRKSFIWTWLEQPNDACKEVGAGAPLDLLARRLRGGGGHDLLP
jgi:hypothetical protein